LVIGIAVTNEEHIYILQNICTKLSSSQDVVDLVKSNDIDKIHKLLIEVNNEN
jgi:mannitol/fructose-specific phosphotransferase system IIA component